MLMLLMSLAASACAVPVDGSKPLPFELRQNAVIVRVFVSGEGPFRFLLDTGASRSAVGEHLLRGAGAVTNDRILMITPAGRSVHRAVRLSLALGAREAVAITATVVADEALDIAGVAVDGIVGQDVLSSLVYTIDYRQRTISWNQQIACSEPDRLDLTLAGGRAIVTIPAQAGLTRALELIPDTGSDAVVFFAREGSVLPPATPLDIGTLRTLSGVQLVRRVRVDRLRVGSVVLEDQEAVVIGEGSGALPPGDGLLPLHIFSRVTVNGPAGFIAVSR